MSLNRQQFAGVIPPCISEADVKENETEGVLMFEKAMVGYIDILGYQDLVRRAMRKPDLVRRLEQLFYGVSVRALNDMGSLDLSEVVEGTDKNSWKYFQEVTKTIRVRNNADSFIFTLPLSKVSTLFGENASILHSIETYLSVMTMFSTLLISKIGYLLRGGISIGNHYESERESQLFVFSEAHNRAVTLENEKAENPRIVMDEHLRLYLEKIVYPYTAKFFYRDEDGRYCLDIYSSLHIWADLKVKLLANIKENIMVSMEHNFGQAKELTKLFLLCKIP